MITLTLGELAAVLEAPFQGDATRLITGVAFDSRQIAPGNLFLALPGTNGHDGHDYVAMAAAQGAGAALVVRDNPHAVAVTTPAVFVADVYHALQKLTRWYLARVAPKVIAITGSNGKTTTKDFVAAIAGQRYRTYKTPDNFNNEIGVPMTVLGMPATTEVLVVELGMDRPGQICQLSLLVEPDLAIITMIGEAHIEFFGTRACIAEAKLEIAAGLKATGKLFVPSDEPLLCDNQTARTLGDRLVPFGDAAVLEQARIIGKTTHFDWRGQKFAIPLLGRYNVMNALAALTATRQLEISLADAALGLIASQITGQRTEMLTTTNGVTIISDVYNSNPTAVREVLKSFHSDVSAKQKYLVLGDMLELGMVAKEQHADLAEAVIAAEPTAVYLVGPLMTTALYARLCDLFPRQLISCYASDQLAALGQELQQTATTGDAILLKASHGLHFEQLTALLTD